VRKLIRGGISAVIATLFVVLIGVQPAQASWYDYLVGTRYTGAFLGEFGALVATSFMARAAHSS